MTQPAHAHRQVRVLVVQNQAIESLGALAFPLVAGDIELRLWRAWQGGDAPRHQDLDGLVVLGGAANPDQADDLAWLRREQDFLASALSKRVPTLGVCLGAELLSQALGGSVFRLRRPEIGWLRIDATPASADDPVGRSLPGRASVFGWHSYGFDAPAGARELAVGGQSLQAFVYEDFAWGVQFHPNADGATIGTWVRRFGAELEAHRVDPEVLLSETKQRLEASDALARSLAANFVDVVRSRSASAIATGQA